VGRFGGIFGFDTNFDTVDYLVVLIVVFGECHYVVTTRPFPFNGNHKAIASSLKRLSLVVELWFNLGPSGWGFDLLVHMLYPGLISRRSGVVAQESSGGLHPEPA